MSRSNKESYMPKKRYEIKNVLDMHMRLTVWDENFWKNIGM